MVSSTNFLKNVNFDTDNQYFIGQQPDELIIYLSAKIGVRVKNVHVTSILYSCAFEGTNIKKAVLHPLGLILNTMGTGRPELNNPATNVRYANKRR